MGYAGFGLNEVSAQIVYNRTIATTTRAFIPLAPTAQYSADRPARTPQEAEVSLRDELATQIANASSELEAQLVTLRASAQHSELTQAQSALDGLAQLQKQVSQADIRVLATMRGAVTAFVASASAIAQQAVGSAGALTSAQALHEARANARASTENFMRDYFEDRKFDPYLQFASRDDEEKYRRDEETRRRAIEKARAEGTPQGDLRANRLAIEQLKDAGAHGADKSPDFKDALGQLEKSEEKLQNAVESNEAKAAPDLDPSILAAFKSSVSTTADTPVSGHGLVGGAAAQPSQGNSR